MKHRKLSISLISAFIAALGLSACSDVTAKDNSILTLKGYDGQTIDIDAGAIFNQYKTSADGISSFYKAILEVLIRNYFETSTNPDVKSKLASLKTQAENKVKGVEEDARLNAEKNGTSYEEEWNKLLDSNKVENRDELKDMFLYNFEKAEKEDKYFEDHLSSLTSEYIGFKQKTDSTAWEAYRGVEHSAMLPYHIRHILVKTTASATDFTSGEITQDEAKKLNTVYEALSNGKNTFGQVASNWSDDSSASVFGDSGIMDVSENFVNEFKLGIFAYDGLYGKSVTGDQATNRDEYFGLSDAYNQSGTASTVKTQLSNIGLGQVSYEVFLRLGETYKTEKSDDGLSVNDGAAKYFPRNIYWNNYLNLHNVFVITSNGLTDSGTHWATPADPVDKAGFREIGNLGLSTGTKVLTDEAGRVIVGVRSEYGIHFMIMQRTPFEFDGTINSYNPATTGYNYNDVKINEYYTTKTPDDQGYPKTNEGKDKVTFVNFLNADKSVYTDRANKVETKIKGFDSMYDYRIYEEFAANNQIQVNDPTVKTEIDRYIAQKRDYIGWSDEQNVTKTWQTYLDLLNLQYEMRGDDYGTNLDGSKRLTKITCAINFGSYDPDNALWKKGGACYYGK